MKSFDSEYILHELRNALHPIVHLSKRLIREHDGSNTQIARSIHRSAQRLRIYLERLEEGFNKMALRRNYVDIPAQLHSVVSDFESFARSHSVKLSLDFSQDIPPVEVDRCLMEMLFTNLIINAIEASPDGGEVKVGVFFKDGAIHIEVSDEGVGIDPESQRRMFERGYSSKVGTGRPRGNGLFLCREIIEFHGGEIKAVNQKKGAKFIVRLPVSAGMVFGDSSIAVFEVSGSVLVVDDDGGVLNSIYVSLKGVGLEVDRAESASLAMAMMDRKDYGYVIADVGMNGAGGIEVYHCIRLFHPELLSNTVFITGQSSSSAALKYLRNRGVKVLYKPFTMDDLLIAMGFNAT
jgi:CheY-like chemotaxis protein